MPFKTLLLCLNILPSLWMAMEMATCRVKTSAGHQAAKALKSGRKCFKHQILSFFVCFSVDN